MTVIGLTGQTGSGKTTISNLLSQKGAKTIDVDILAREIVHPGGEVIKEIEKTFSKDMINSDGSLNRRKLAGIVFADEEQLIKLNAITHPALLEEVKSSLDDINGSCGDSAVAVVDAAVLIEAQMLPLCDYVIVPECGEEKRVERIMLRDALTRERAVERVRAQKDISYFKAYADFVVNTDGNIEDTMMQIDRIWDIICLTRNVPFEKGE